MELVVEPDIYSPSIDDKGNYIDKIPSFNIIKKGLSCPCGSRRDKVYETHSIFASHIKTKTHQKWLEGINRNKANYYIEYEKLKDLVQNQRLIIGQLEKDLINKNLTIDYLTQQLVSQNKNMNCRTVDNLLDMDIH
jgi:hypothetical protein